VDEKQRDEKKKMKRIEGDKRSRGKGGKDRGRSGNSRGI